MNIPDELLLCIECGRTCPCAYLYKRGTAHVHLPGGDDRYPLCLPCEERFLKRHRFKLGTGYTWRNRCLEGCVYDHIAKTVPIRQGLEAGP